ncbi:MAG: CerR family C-terminal domain-containing protein [Phycisphaerales bacterium]
MSSLPIASSPTSEQADTRRRLLEAAGEVFADQGFHHATVREICRRAGANVAAVNYHFRDKESLYLEVLTWCGQVALEKYPVAAGMRPDSTPAERLGAFIRNYLDRLLDEGRPAWHGKLISREMVEPTRALDELAMHFVKPQYQRLREIVAGIISPGGAPVPEALLRQCACSVVGQCLFYKLCRPMLQRIAPEQEYGPAARAEIATHVLAFSLAGLESVRARLAREHSDEDGGAA